MDHYKRQKVRARGEVVVQFEQGEPYIAVKKLTALGISIPEDYTKDYLYRNIYQDIKDAVGIQKDVNSIEAINIYKGKVVVTLF